MRLADHITRVPRAFDPERGAAVAALVPDITDDMRDVIVGTAGCSPYLAGLIEKEATWLPQAMDDTDAALAQVLSPPEADVTTLKPALRQAKRRVALLAGLADLAGAWTLEQVTSALTRLADMACDVALTAALAEQVRRGKLPDTDVGVFVLAMGKMGAGELNYSSDIDLICLFDETRHDPADYAAVRKACVRAVQDMCKVLSDLTPDGYVFRTDLRLRPDPSVNPVVLSAGAAERYYESLGRTWERAAYIKARPCAGDIAAGQAFLEELRPFVWRRHLDFAAVQDAHDMRLAIRAHKGTGGPITLPGHDMKLGRGGIREIEFFTQTRQLIAGGRDADLRVRDTVTGLQRLAEKDWVTAGTRDMLIDHYRFARTVEHRVQMQRDAQTHKLPGSDEGFERLAAMMATDRAALEAELRDRLSAVHAETEGFFAPDAAEPTPTVALDAAMQSRWRNYPALRSARGAALFDRIEPMLMERLGAATKPQEALAAFDGFLAGLPAGVQLFSLFEANPQLVDLLVDIVGTSPALAHYLSRNAAVLDAVIGGSFFAPWPGRDALTEMAVDRLTAEDDYEAKLDAIRAWAKEWHFRIGVHHLRQLTSAIEAGKQYSDLARASIAALWPEVQAQFAKRHGPPPGRGGVILGMGSLGAGHLTPQSDLDLIVVYDPLDDEQSEGKRPLPVGSYYARLTQAMITAVTTQTAQGRLYEADMRLRPSGNQGPVATSWPSFQRYQREDAWLWEHLALVRATVVAGPEALTGDIAAFREEIMQRPRDQSDVLAELAQMRARIAAAKQPASIWDAKIGPGRLQDIELLAQTGAVLTGALRSGVSAGLDACVAAGVLSDADAQHLAQTHALLWAVQIASRLLSTQAVDMDDLGAGGQDVLLRAVGCDVREAAERQLRDAIERTAGIIGNAVGAAE
ncbi:[glutamate--ammonia-ligase] adenylyltransferase [Tateyamaria sp. ANG-S1]|uniref:[protein-PII] uridylyltransferase family protein n=1 Tax=Tateyamaria sp. ANG-S1 TaxID=1577905 RepID=UPI00057F21F8|nr:[glutamate--ammonia-ligase] adenylyltransferase [Tateyamaria sp. ANG-S1]KIC49277.1 glutamate-ammonia-ligase adenylyltransferase [Tateyamaria sp. ANG-S1]